MFKVHAFIVVLLLVPSAIRADNITVIGAVTYKPTGERRGGIKVGLYCDDAKTCKLGVSKPTAQNGLYGLTKTNLAVGKLFVIYDGPPQYAADPILVRVNCGGQPNEICVLIAEDLALLPPPIAGNNQAAAKWINAYANTQSVKVWAGQIDLATANRETTREAAKILGLATGIGKMPADETIKSVHAVLRELPGSEELPKLDILIKPNEFMKVKDQPEFKHFRDMPPNPKRWKKEGASLSDEIQYLLAVPNADIPLSWVNEPEHFQFVEKYLKSKNTSGSSILHLGGIEKVGILPFKVGSPSGPSKKEISTMLKDYPELRAWAFYGTLVNDKAIQGLDHRLLADRLRSVSPNVIEMRK